MFKIALIAIKEEIIITDERNERVILIWGAGRDI